MALSITPAPCQVPQNDIQSVHQMMEAIAARMAGGVKPVMRGGPNGVVAIEGLTAQQYCDALGTNLPLLQAAAAVINGTMKAVPV